ncbi:hypothetical protein EHP00_2596 [Ecytonucleospora hepatopenaei]|uniref:Uncharacterized protein n=1 Tax=Ecytonucleospora hepatopenaei TaxID=646526 RepID=A0A1W0E2C8_9MICR|nr:hypothetical protein EHP00_2596 [Ecytonucleospora hepatopenaei]
MCFCMKYYINSIYFKKTKTFCLIVFVIIFINKFIERIILIFFKTKNLGENEILIRTKKAEKRILIQIYFSFFLYLSFSIFIHFRFKCKC